jgi:3-deoxy-D-manno-octulosonic-acid transferase
VIQRFRERHPDMQLAYTYFSPSAERFAASTGADFFDYLPFDDSRETAEALDILKPSGIVFSKLDVWPLLVENAVQRDIKTALLSATVPESSNRRSRIALLALRDAYAALDVVGAISPSDAQRLLEMGVRSDRMTVTGDTRYDQVWAKANAPSYSRDDVVARYTDPRPTLVAGSTWPSDEKRLLPAWVQTRRQLPAARLIIAPHELSASHLSSIEKWARESSLTVSRTSEASARATEVVLVDEYGLLADLYAVADASYVGGGFHRDGIHSMLEPAAFGAPVLVGPMHMDNRDAALLVAGGGAVRCRGPGDISARLLAWFTNPQVLGKASASARRVVEAGIGAADRSTELLEGLFTY